MAWGIAWQIILFVLGSIGLGLVSPRSLLQLRSHGFFRFFAWEVLWGMFLLQVVNWFKDPWSWHQLISWTLLIACLGLVIEGVRLLRRIGQRDAGRAETSLRDFEKTSRLVKTGLFRYIRHPMYSSLLLLGWGIFFKAPSWLEAGLALLCTFFLIATGRAEERENIRYFGSEYIEYMHQTKMFIPYIL